MNGNIITEKKEHMITIYEKNPGHSQMTSYQDGGRTIAQHARRESRAFHAWLRYRLLVGISTREVRAHPRADDEFDPRT